MDFDGFNNIKWDIIKDKLNNAKTVKSTRRNDGVYYDISVSFDTETTSMYQGIPKEKFSYMYVWQFGIDGYYCYGRHWSEFIKLLLKLKEYGGLSTEKKLIIYIHNLSFEFQFFRKLIPWSSVFAVDNREPVKALSSWGIEFRDSLILSGYKLANVAKNLTKHKIPKMVGDLDYTLIRNTKTSFSEKEKGYMLNDVRILIAYIDEQRDQYGDIAHIPLTNTGRVRQLVRKNCFGKNWNTRSKYLDIMNVLQLSKSDYIESKKAFAGGFTHANPNRVGGTFNNVSSIDFTSSYPTVMIAEKYPSSRAMDYHYKNRTNFEKMLEKRLAIFKVKFINLVTKVNQDNYLSSSRGSSDDIFVVENNGRVYSARQFTTYITSIDWEIIKQVYTWDRVEFSEIKTFTKHYLPTPIIKSIIDLYQKKTTLKNVQGKEAEYLHAKGMLNSIYGMSVTDIIRDETLYEDDEWEQVQANPDELLEKYNNSKNRFLYYPWGVFVTAYARRNLWNGIINIGDDYIYSDTDSIKMLHYENHKEYVKNYNKNITEKLEKAMKYHRLPIDSVRPKTVKGVEKPLGVWDFEGTYSHFKTLGAKRYIYDINGDLHITIAGLNKKLGAKYLMKISDNDINKVYKNFKNDLSVPKGQTGKMTHTYIDELKSFEVKDFQGHVTRETALSSVHLENASFHLSLSKAFKDFLHDISNGYIITSLDSFSKGI